MISTGAEVKYAFKDAQVGVHPNLNQVVQRHAETRYQRPFAAHTQAAFEVFLEKSAVLRSTYTQGIVLDAGCGTGMSTHALSLSYPQALVVGIDRSAARLARDRSSSNMTSAELPYRQTENSLILRANLIDFWRLIVANNIQVKKTYLLYPNPYPKRSQLRSRWHGHPVFKDLIQSTEEIELRSNWRIYVDEFARAVSTLRSSIELTGKRQVRPQAETSVYQPDEPISVFERRYLNAGCPIYRYSTSLV